MDLATKLDNLHSQAKANKWLRYFAVFNRIVLAAGFIPSGLTKIFGERFTSLSTNHPMGHYLEALFHTGFYYPFIGYVQVVAAILLLIPRTATLGAVLYFPLILNICILSLAVCFEGSMLSSPLMVLANLYLLAWDYDKLKYILPFKHDSTNNEKPIPDQLDQNNKSTRSRFPLRFFLIVIATVLLVFLAIQFAYDIKPRNTLRDCSAGCNDNDKPNACANFCDCIHTQGKPYGECLEEYKKSSN